ncbi:unnamed protein product [Paramecium sonneborni]|uniref:Transmembrane protein n=1 Tax=Paramecium sonneborni TaxID=65129 RepID=A0A8S1RVC8_9CILI|nr:unnamed protein product [Paramecium sonneborni]
MTEKVIQILLLINHEICMILLQYEAFQQNITLIIKIIDLMIMALCARILYSIKDQKKSGYPFLILGILRISAQLTLNYFYRQKILLYFKNNQQMTSVWLNQLIYLLLGMCFLKNNFLIILSIILSFRQINYKQNSEKNPQKESKDFDICISALPQKEFDPYKSEDVNIKVLYMEDYLL